MEHPDVRPARLRLSRADDAHALRETVAIQVLELGQAIRLDGAVYGQTVRLDEQAAPAYTARVVGRGLICLKIKPSLCRDALLAVAAEPRKPAISSFINNVPRFVAARIICSFSTVTSSTKNVCGSSGSGACFLLSFGNDFQI